MKRLYLEGYGVVEGENHMITKKLKTVVSQAVSFFASQIH